MSFITYSAFRTAVRAIAFPEGAAENLDTTIDSYIQDALINLQTFVPCLRDNHVDFYDKSEFQEWCNTDFTYVQRGVIHAVYAFKPGKECRKFHFDQKSTSFIGEWMDQQRCVKCGDQTEPTDIAASPLCNVLVNADVACDDYYDNADESDCLFKASRRYYGLGPTEKLYLAPRIPCGYKVAVHWEGIKRKWEDTDPLPDDTELKVAVAKYTLAQSAIFLDRDTNIYDRIMHPKAGEFNLARADMIHRCTRERRIQERHQALDGMDVLQPFFFDPLPEQSVFAIVGDYGSDNSDRDSIASLVAGWGPEYVVTVGDNWYGTDITEPDLIARQGAIYEEYNDNGNFYPVIGNHDRDPVGRLAVEQAHFPALTDSPYYTFTRGLVQFFVLDSGYDNSQVNQQPDGVSSTSIQALWLRDRLAASSAIYKIVALHHPPYTSFDSAATGPTLSSDGYLMYPALRWPFKEWGASLVMVGHIHAYERLEVDGLTYITNGAGGYEALQASDFPDPLPESKFRYTDNFSAIKGVASRDKLVLELRNPDDQLIERVVIRGQSDNLI